jgi:hypothetical protein
VVIFDEAPNSLLDVRGQVASPHELLHRLDLFLEVSCSHVDGADNASKVANRE